jgi:two-component system LytT family sensor kinase
VPLHNGTPEQRAGADWRRLLRLVFTVLAVWIVLGVFLGLQIYVNAPPSSSRTVLQTLNYSVRRYCIYALLTFPVIWLCRRYPLPSKQWIRSVVAHLAGLAAFALFYTGLRVVISPPVAPGTLEKLPVTLESAASLLRSNIFDDFWMYASIVLVTLAYQYHSKLRERELREVELQRQMAEYELQILKLQLHPHFLFNTLNGISALMTRDINTARKMLVRLSELLRVALAHSSDKEVTLKEEMEFVEAYLQLEQMRFGERLRVALEIHPDTLDARVPNMILQPLLENAVRHGVAAVRSGGTIELKASRVDNLLRIEITNDGPPLAVAAVRPARSGLGLGNTRARLWQLYGETYELCISSRAEGGAQLCLDMPFRAAVGSEQTT